MNDEQQPPANSDPGPEGSVPPPQQPGWGQTPPPGGPPPPGYGPPGYGQTPPPPGYGQAPPGGAGGFSVGNAFSWGWAKFQANLGPIIIAALVLFVASAAIQFIGNLVTGAIASPARIEYDPDSGMFETSGGGFFGLSFFVSMLFSALSYAVSLVIQAGIIRGALDAAEGRKIDLNAMFTRIDFVQVLIASVIIGALTFIGLILCVLPGIAVMFFTWFTLWFVVGKGLPAVEALKASFEFTKNNIGALIIVLLASVAAMIVGTLACLIGLLVAFPVVILAHAYTFKTLNNEPVAP